MADEAFKTKNVVLVHGAFADGSSWSGVVERLQVAGLHVTAVQNPLISLTADVRATRRVLAMPDGPTVLVGHSYGGTVISEVGVDPKVTGLHKARLTELCSIRKQRLLRGKKSRAGTPFRLRTVSSIQIWNASSPSE